MINQCLIILSFLLGACIGIGACYLGFIFGLKIGTSEKEELTDVSISTKYKEPAEFELLPNDKKKDKR